MTWQPRYLSQVLRTYAYEFVGIQEAQALLDQLERSHPTLVHEVVPKVAMAPLFIVWLRFGVDTNIVIFQVIAGGDGCIGLDNVRKIGIIKGINDTGARHRQEV